MAAHLVTWYWAVCLIVFVYWLTIFWLDQETKKTDLFSWSILLIGPFFWPIILPLSSRELSSKKRHDF